MVHAVVHRILQRDLSPKLMGRTWMKARFFCIDSDHSVARLTKAEALSLLEHWNLMRWVQRLIRQIAEASGVEICLGTSRLSARIWH